MQTRLSALQPWGRRSLLLTWAFQLWFTTFNGAQLYGYPSADSDGRTNRVRSFTGFCAHWKMQCTKIASSWKSKYMA